MIQTAQMSHQSLRQVSPTETPLSHSGTRPSPTGTTRTAEARKTAQTTSANFNIVSGDHDRDHPHLDSAPHFKLGRVSVTFAAEDLVAAAYGPDRVRCEIGGLLERHESGDFGDIDASDQRANTRACLHGGVILSAYQLAGRRRGRTVLVLTRLSVWTDRDGLRREHTETIVMLPGE